MCCEQEWQLLLSYFLSYFPLMVLGVISCPPYNLNTFWNIFMILHRYAEQVMTMCREQEWQLLLSYCLSYFPLDCFRCDFVSALYLNTFWNIFMILHRYVEQVMEICREQEWQLLLSYFFSYFPLMILGVHSITWIPFEIFSWYFTDMHTRSCWFVWYMNDNSCIHILWVISLW